MSRMPELQYMFIYLGWQCNLNCKHCWVPKDQYEMEAHLSESMVDECLQFAEQMNVRSIKISGGEPMLYKKSVAKIINFAKKYGIYISIETNGTLLDKKFVEDNYYERLSYSVSIDSSDAQVHNAFRGAKFAFEKSVDAIKYIIDNGMGCGVTYSTYDGNENDIDRMIRFCENNAVKHMKINPIVKMGRAENFDDNYSMTTISPEKILQLYAKYCLHERNGVHVSIMVPPAFSGLYFLKDIAQKNPENICANCPTFNILSILPNGDVGLCAEAYRSNDLKFGNINQQSLYDIWNGEKMQQFRNSLFCELDGVCSDCRVKEICWGGCRAIALKKYGKVNAPNPFCQEMKEKGKFFLSGK